MLALIPVVLSIGAVYALIPVIVIVILIAAAAGLRNGFDSIFGMFGFAAIASFVGGKGAIGGGKAGRGITGAKYKSDSKAMRGTAGKLGEAARKAREKAMIEGDKGQQGALISKANSILNPDSYRSAVASGPTVEMLATQRKNSIFNRGKTMNQVRLAVAQDVIRRHRAGVAPERLSGRLSAAEQARVTLSKPKDIALDHLHRSTLTSQAAAALENRMHPHMQESNDVLNATRNEIYRLRNEPITRVFPEGSAGYRAASTFDNWSERVLGTRMLASSFRPENVTEEGGRTGGTGEPLPTTYWGVWALKYKNFAKDFSRWSFMTETGAGGGGAPPPPGT